MKILAIDTSSAICSAAVCEDSKLISEININTQNTHSEILLPSVERLLKLSDLKIDDIDLFACAAGPGSFTGVRIGAATVKGLAFARNKPCAAVSSVEALAVNLSCFDGILCPVINARRMHVYNAVFVCKDGIYQRLTPDRLIAIEELERELENHRAQYDRDIYLSGDGYELCAENFTHTDIKNNLYLSRKLSLQSAYSIGLAALTMYNRRQTVSDRDILPSYLRPSQAERERKEKSDAE